MIENYNEILNYSKLIFDDKEYDYILKLLNDNKLNTLRLYIDEKIEFLNVESVLKPNDPVLDTQLSMCNRLEDLVIDCYLESLEN